MILYLKTCTKISKLEVDISLTVVIIECVGFLIGRTSVLDIADCGTARRSRTRSLVVTGRISITLPYRTYKTCSCLQVYVCIMITLLMFSITLT